jgi:hypothetical protein
VRDKIPDFLENTAGEWGVRPLKKTQIEKNFTISRLAQKVQWSTALFKHNNG